MTEETRRWIWALGRIFLGSVQMTAALIGAGLLMTTGASAMTTGVTFFAGACTALSLILFRGQGQSRHGQDAQDGGAP